jgi:hypothetical protein
MSHIRVVIRVIIRRRRRPCRLDPLDGGPERCLKSTGGPLAIQWRTKDNRLTQSPTQSRPALAAIGSRAEAAADSDFPCCHGLRTGANGGH